MPSRVQAVAVEIADDSVQKWNEELARASAKLSTHQADKLKVVSLPVSHTNFALRLLAQEVEHESQLVSGQGQLSMARLQQRDHAFHEAALHGLAARKVPRPSHSFCTVSRRKEHELQVAAAARAVAAGGRQWQRRRWRHQDADAGVEAWVRKERAAPLHLRPQVCRGPSAVFLQETENFVSPTCMLGGFFQDACWPSAECLDQARVRRSLRQLKPTTRGTGNGNISRQRQRHLFRQQPQQFPR